MCVCAHLCWCIFMFSWGNASTANYKLVFLHADYGGENYAHIIRKNAETPLTERKSRKDDCYFFPVHSFSSPSYTAQQQERA